MGAGGTDDVDNLFSDKSDRIQSHKDGCETENTGDGGFIQKEPTDGGADDNMEDYGYTENEPSRKCQWNNPTVQPNMGNGREETPEAYKGKGKDKGKSTKSHTTTAEEPQNTVPEPPNKKKKAKNGATTTNTVDYNNDKAEAGQKGKGDKEGKEPVNQPAHEEETVTRTPRSASRSPKQTPNEGRYTYNSPKVRNLIM